MSLPNEGWLDRPCPRIRVERPTMREHDGRAFAPILVVDAGAVFRGDGAHDSAPCGGSEHVARARAPSRPSNSLVGAVTSPGKTLTVPRREWHRANFSAS